MSRIAALVFAKPPVPGLAKTRLATELGPDDAARVAAALLADTVDGLRAQGVHAILSTPDPAADHGVDLEAWDQGAGGLGDRLERTFRRALARFARVVAVGGDAPGMPPAHLATVCETPGDAVLAPSDDGGFWALRLDRCPEGLLDGIAWSVATTAEEATARLSARGLTVVAGPRWFDVDTPDDLRRLRREVPRDRAARTHALLDALGWPVP